MASGGKRGAGDRVLESRHVIGLFLLMLVFSGVFFTLGYVMGRNQYDGQVRAASDGMGRPDIVKSSKLDPAPKRTAEAPADGVDSDPATSTSSDNTWKFYDNDKSSKVAPHLEPAPKSPVAPPVSRTVNAKAPVQPSAPAPRAKKAPRMRRSCPTVHSFCRWPHWRSRMTRWPWQAACRKSIFPRRCSSRRKISITACRSARLRTRRVPTPRKKVWRAPASRLST